MVMEKEDLRLSLSLSFPAEKRITVMQQLNLIPSTISPPPPNSAFNNLIHKSPNWTLVDSSSDRNSETCRLVETRSFLKGIDVNRMPAATGEAEEEAGVSSPNSTISSVSGNKRSEREANCEENEMERASSRGISDEEDGENCRKKLRLTKEQSAILEDSFKEHHTLNPKQKLALAKRLGLRPRQVEVWFQNRRAR